MIAPINVTFYTTLRVRSTLGLKFQIVFNLWIKGSTNTITKLKWLEDLTNAAISTTLPLCSLSYKDIQTTITTKCSYS